MNIKSVTNDKSNLFLSDGIIIVTLRVDDLNSRGVLNLCSFVVESENAWSRNWTSSGKFTYTGLIKYTNYFGIFIFTGYFLDKFD